MPLTIKGRKIMRSLIEQYGADKAKKVFYSMVNSGKITGAEKKSKPRKKKK